MGRVDFKVNQNKETGLCHLTINCSKAASVNIVMALLEVFPSEMQTAAVVAQESMVTISVYTKDKGKIDRIVENMEFAAVRRMLIEKQKQEFCQN